MPPTIEAKSATVIAGDRTAWRPRSCPICAKRSTRQWMEEQVDMAALGRFAFSSRKLPEYMRFRLAICTECDLVFADPVPPLEWFRENYREADFDAGGESQFAADTYARELARLLPRLQTRRAALDIGAGDGAFVSRLLAAGFASVIGVEPSRQPIAQADASIRHLLRNDFFREEDFEPESFDLITCFQTLEHLEDPLALCRSAQALLRPGGMLLLAGHNFRSPVARIMGRNSPIYDIEHLQLFSPVSLARLCRAAGYQQTEVRPLSNAYPASYWLKLMPMPAGLKSRLLHFANTRPIGKAVIPARVGNLVAAAIKKA